MNQDDRYRTTSWDGDEVARRSGEHPHRDPGPAGDRPPRSAGADQGASRSTAPAKKKKRRKKRTNPLLAILL